MTCVNRWVHRRVIHLIAFKPSIGVFSVRSEKHFCTVIVIYLIIRLRSSGMRRMKMESYQTLAVIYQTTRHHIPEEPSFLTAVQTDHLHYYTAVETFHDKSDNDATYQ